MIKTGQLEADSSGLWSDLNSFQMISSPMGDPPSVSQFSKVIPFSRIIQSQFSKVIPFSEIIHSQFSKVTPFSEIIQSQFSKVIPFPRIIQSQFSNKTDFKGDFIILFEQSLSLHVAGLTYQWSTHDHRWLMFYAFPILEDLNVETGIAIWESNLFRKISWMLGFPHPNQNHMFDDRLPSSLLRSIPIDWVWIEWIIPWSSARASSLKYCSRNLPISL
jgi:hypothetical protein